MSKMKRLIYIVLAIMAMSSCTKIQYKVYDNPYVYVKFAGDLGQSETSNVMAMSNNLERTYNFCLSSKKLDYPLTVYYEITVGDGLTEGVDFEILSEDRSVVIEPGEFIQGFVIKYLRRKVDKTQDNTLTIRITKTEPEINIGIPGSTPSNVTHTIKKVN